MMTNTTPSTFALLVDKLRDKSEEDLKHFYNELLSEELIKEWASVTEESSFENVSDDDIVKAIMQRRYKSRL